VRRWWGGVADAESAGKFKLTEWQIAIATLIGAAEGPDFLMHARMGLLRALNHGKPVPAITPRGKPAKAYRIVR
jgi:hypothetical protein